jgi:hypothetical protein
VKVLTCILLLPWLLFPEDGPRLVEEAYASFFKNTEWWIIVGLVPSFNFNLLIFKQEQNEFKFSILFTLKCKKYKYKYYKRYANTGIPQMVAHRSQSIDRSTVGVAFPPKSLNFTHRSIPHFEQCTRKTFRT